MGDIMKSRINWDSENNEFVESKKTQQYKKYMAKIKSMRDYISGENDNANILAEGTKVRLNYDSIVNEPVYKSKRKAYKKFVNENKDKVFTVEYDAKYKDKPILVSLKEDDGEVKWLWHCESDLIVVDETNE